MHAQDTKGPGDNIVQNIYVYPPGMLSYKIKTSCGPGRKNLESVYTYQAQIVGTYIPTIFTAATQQNDDVTFALARGAFPRLIAE